jgi:hypothetical protein
MNLEEFCKQAELNQELADYIDEVAQATDPEQANRTIMFDAIFAVTAFALFRMAKNYFDYKRGLNESDLRQKLLDQVDGLVQKGWSRDKALATVQSVSRDVAKLRVDSPVLEACLEILTRGAKSSGGK